METQDKSRFSIITSTGGGYYFLKEKIRYILPVIVPLLIMYVLFFHFVHYAMGEDTTLFQVFLVHLPITLYEGWLVCILSRYMIMGEDFSKLPQDPAYLEKRRLHMSAAIYIFILFGMAVFLFRYGMTELVEARLKEYAAILEQAKLEGKKPHEVEIPDGQSFLWMMPFIIFMFWAARLMMLPAFVALGGNVKQYLRDMSGAMASVRVLCMWFLSAIPIMTLFMFVTQGLYQSEGGATSVSLTLVYIIQSIMWAMFLVVKIGAFNTALQEIYQNR